MKVTWPDYNGAREAGQEEPLEKECKTPEPIIRILQPGDEAALRAFVLPRLASSVFLLSNMQAAGLADHGEVYQGSYAAAFEGDAIVGVAAHYWQGNLVLQAPKHSALLWRAAVRASGRPLSGMVGPAEQVTTVFQQLALTLAELVVPPALASGALRGRAMEPRDLELITNWRVGYALEALGEPDTPETHARCRAAIERQLNEGRMWLVETQGQPVACSGFNAVTPEVVQVGGVWTPPALRSRGYARAAVATSLLAARAQGVPLAVLFAGDYNIAAQKAYRSLGFRQVGEFRLVRLKDSRWL
jgi:RimJ/RimL family protein N-acetyltransferase